jgi:adenylate cyclase
VRYVLEGSVRKAGNRVRITGQLIDTTIGAHLWADRFDGALEDIFELQDQIAGSVVGAIEPKLRQSEIERAVHKPTDSLAAWDLYLRSLAAWHQFTENGMREAVALLQRALAIDPSYAPAAAMIGWCRIHQRTQRLGAVSDAEVEEAVRLAKRAIEVGIDDPDALWMAAYTLMSFSGDYARAANVVVRALALNPNSAHAWMVRGYVSVMENQPDAAIEALEHAIRLSPLDPLSRAFSIGLASAHLAADRYERAIEWAERTLAEEPRHRAAMRIEAVCFAFLGRIEEARHWLARYLEAEPGLTIAQFKSLAPAFSPEFLRRYVEGLRKAGLPEA